MNIIINDFCNLRCPYCFAEEFNVNSNTMGLEDFSSLIEWFRKQGVTDMNIVGGEPTVHPQFNEILEIYNKYIDEVNGNSTIYSNGIEIRNFIPYFHKNTKLLINTNNPEVIGETKWEKLKQNLYWFHQNNWFNMTIDNVYKVSLGCNIYTNNFNDYEYIWKLVEEYNLPVLRVSICVPKNDTYYIRHRDEYFKNMKSVFMQFVYKAIETHTWLDLDCSQIPMCYFSGDELFLIEECTNGLLGMHGCNHLLCVLPNLKVSGCFSELNFAVEDKYYYDYNSIDEIDQLMYMKHLANISGNFDDKCTKCKTREFGLCQNGCVGFIS